jgi:hypothetical protein
VPEAAVEAASLTSPSSLLATEAGIVLLLTRTGADMKPHY